jgi:hypothetical protein
MGGHVAAKKINPGFRVALAIPFLPMLKPRISETSTTNPTPS